MTLQYAIIATTRLLSFAILLQSIELFAIVRKPFFFSIWSFENLKFDFVAGLPLPESGIRFLFSDLSIKVISIVAPVIAFTSLILADPFLFLILAAFHLVICIRFRGSFNGGSDYMTLVVLTGTLITLFSSSESAQRLGLIYIAIHSLYSYFKAGLVKIRNSSWRNGSVLIDFLKHSIYKDIQPLSNDLKKYKKLQVFAGWSTLIFELTIPIILFFPKLALFYCIIAILFHFLNFMLFGLNRFFWIWIATWPAILCLFK